MVTSHIISVFYYISQKQVAEGTSEETRTDYIDQLSGSRLLENYLQRVQQLQPQQHNLKQNGIDNLAHTSESIDSLTNDVSFIKKMVFMQKTKC